MIRDKYRASPALVIGCSAGLLFGFGLAMADVVPPPQPFIGNAVVVPSPGEAPECNRPEQPKAAKKGRGMRRKARFSSYDDCIKEHSGSAEHLQKLQPVHRQYTKDADQTGQPSAQTQGTRKKQAELAKAERKAARKAAKAERRAAIRAARAQRKAAIRAARAADKPAAPAKKPGQTKPAKTAGALRTAA